MSDKGDRALNALAGEDEGAYWHGRFESAMAALAALRREYIETLAEVERLRERLTLLDPHEPVPVDSDPFIRGFGPVPPIASS